MKDIYLQVYLLGKLTEIFTRKFLFYIPGHAVRGGRRHVLQNFGCLIAVTLPKSITVAVPTIDFTIIQGD